MLCLLLKEEVTYTKKTKREYKKNRRNRQGGSAASSSRAAESRLPQYNEVDVLSAAQVQEPFSCSEEDIASPVSQ